MKKILFSFLFILCSYSLSFAQNWDILSIKHMFSPVLSSTDYSAKVITMLQKWYIVLDLWTNGDYTHVMLTDGKKGYMLSSYLENYTFNNYKINGNKWSIKSNTAFYSGPNSSSKKLGTLKSGNEFYILHVNYINSNFLKIKILTWAYKNRTWYIENNNINVSHISSFKNEIEKFIEKYANKESSLTYLNNGKQEYTPLFEWDEENSPVSVFQKNAKTNTSQNNIYASWALFGMPVNNFSTGTTNENKTNTNDDLSDFLNLLNLDNLWGNSWTQTTNNTNRTSSGQNNSNTSSQEELNDFLNLLNLNNYMSGTTNTPTQDEINDFFNLLNGQTQTSENNNTTNNIDINDFLNMLNSGL